MEVGVDERALSSRFGPFLAGSMDIDLAGSMDCVPGWRCIIFVGHIWWWGILDWGLGVEMHFYHFGHSTISYLLPSFAFAAMLFPGAIFETERAFGITWELTYSLQRG